MSLESDFEIKVSEIENAGMGLFAKKDIRAGVVILEYTGKKCRATSHKDHTYCYAISDNFCICAQDIGGIARYINDCRGSSRVENLDWVEKKKRQRVFIRTMREIKAGEELYIKYGEKYWE